MATAPPDSTEPTFAYGAGDVIAGKYALEQLLGEGGMGAVFRARNLAIDMPVAVKLIRTTHDREVLSNRLRQEARATAKLAHPAIVRVFDVGQTALGDPFIVMELLEGESLASLIDREGRLTSARAVQLLLPIADALSAAHAKGLVHRDVKPDNVFVAKDDDGQLQPKLVDFGIVKHEQAGDAGKLTQAGSVLGSPDYMSPEQARGLDQVDHRSDIWSFSVLLYESIAGVAPFQSSNYNALLRSIVEEAAPTLAERSAADAELSGIVAQGMRKNPDERHASMSAMGKALATWLTMQGIFEDACGVSLEARWLSRALDSRAPRTPRSSWPDGSPEAPSGVRAVSALGHAPTQPHSTTPLASTVHAPAPAPERTNTRLLLLAAFGGALLAMAGGALLLRQGHSEAEPPSSAAAASRVLSGSAPLPVRTPVAAEAVSGVLHPEPATPATASPSSMSPPAAASSASRTDPTGAPRSKATVKPSAARGRPAPPAPAASPKPRSDLLAPY